MQIIDFRPMNQCPNCGCIEILLKAKKKRKGCKMLPVANVMRPVIMFYENYKIWVCGNNKCGHQWNQILNRYDFNSSEIINEWNYSPDDDIIYED